MKSEASGIAKAGAKMVMAVSCAKVKLSRPLMTETTNLAPMKLGNNV